MSTLLEHLLKEHVLVCPQEETPIYQDFNGNLVNKNGRIYQVENNAIDLFADYEDIEPFPNPPRGFLVGIAKSLDLDHTSDELISKISKAVQSTLLVPKGSKNLQAEIRELASRMNLEEPEDWLSNIKGRQKLKDKNDLEVYQDVKISVLRHFLNGQILAGSQQFFSFRIRNEGSSILSSRLNHPFPFLLSYHWADSDGIVTEFEGRRSTLPQDFFPEEEITIMVDIAAPTKPGKFILQLRPLQEGLRWYEHLGLDIPIDVVTSLTHSLVKLEPVLKASQNSVNAHAKSESWKDPKPILERNDEPFNYEKDIQAVQGILTREFPEKTGGSRYRLLEIAGGVYPQAMSLVTEGRADLLSVDISFAQCQLGSIIFSQNENIREHFQFIAADAYNLPIAPHSMDGIVICAALHHFPDPIRLLSSLHKFLKPEGKLIIVREPCAPNPFDAQYLRDISLGINEQQWNLQEYAHIFDQSKFTPQYALVRSGVSLMVVLKSSKRPSCP